MRGKLLIVLIIGVAVAAAAFAWFWNYNRAAQARKFWGKDAATIRFAKKVEAFQNAPKAMIVREASPGRWVQPIGAPTDITGAPGLLNATTSLMADDGYDWTMKPVVPGPDASEWRLGVRFHGKDRPVTLLFSDRSDTMLVVEQGEVLTLSPKTAAGWKDYLKRALKIEEK